MSISENLNRPARPPQSTEAERRLRQSSTAATEQAFLQHEAERARSAFGATCRELKAGLTARADPRRLIRNHPAASLASAAAVGGLLGLKLTRRGPSTASRSHTDSDTRAEPPRDDSRQAATSPGWLSSILSSAFASLSQAAKLAVTRFVIGLVDSSLAAWKEPAANDRAEHPSEVPDDTVAASR